MEYLLLKGFKKSSLFKLDLKLVINKLFGFNYFRAGEDVSMSIAEMLNGKKVSEVLTTTEEFVARIKGNFYEYTMPVANALKGAGYEIVLVTNEPDFLAELIKPYVLADDAVGLDFGIRGEFFFNKVENDLFSRSGKASIAAKYASEHNISLDDSIAMGDSEGDIEMLKLVGKGILIGNGAELNGFANTLKIRVVRRDKVLEEIVQGF